MVRRCKYQACKVLRECIGLTKVHEVLTSLAQSTNENSFVSQKNRRSADADIADIRETVGKAYECPVLLIKDREK